VLETAGQLLWVCQTASGLRKSKQRPSLAAEEMPGVHKRGEKVLVYLSASSGSLEVSWLVAMAIFLHHCGYLETSFLLQI